MLNLCYHASVMSLTLGRGSWSGSDAWVANTSSYKLQGLWRSFTKKKKKNKKMTW